MSVSGAVVTDLVRIGGDEDGNTIYITVKLGDKEETLIFPHKMIPKMVLALMTVASTAQDTRAKRYGSDANAKSAEGIQSLNVSDFALGLARKTVPARIGVILSLKVRPGMSFDLALTPELADRFADSLRETLSEIPKMKARKPN